MVLACKINENATDFASTNKLFYVEKVPVGIFESQKCLREQNLVVKHSSTNGGNALRVSSLDCSPNGGHARCTNEGTLLLGAKASSLSGPCRGMRFRGRGFRIRKRGDGIAFQAVEQNYPCTGD